MRLRQLAQCQAQLAGRSSRTQHCRQQKVGERRGCGCAGDIVLNVPDMDLSDPAALAADAEAMAQVRLQAPAPAAAAPLLLSWRYSASTGQGAQVEAALASWLAAITDLLQQETTSQCTGRGALCRLPGACAPAAQPARARPAGAAQRAVSASTERMGWEASGLLCAPGPLAEVVFWRTRNTVVGGMFEQLSRPGPQALIAFAEERVADTHLVQSFSSAFASLQRVRP